MNELENVRGRNTVKYFSFIIFIGLLILRYPFLIINRLGQTDIPDSVIRYVFENGTYCLTAVLILLERDRLSQFKINLFAITIFLLAPILRPIVYWATAKHIPFSGMGFSWIEIIVSVILSLVLILSRTRIQKDSLKYTLKWTVISVFVGVLTSIGISFVYRYFDTRGDLHPTFTIYIVLFITQLSSAAICEEPLFRGFLWGYLEKRGWKQIWVCLFQAGIFCIGHLYYLPDFPVFFIGTFVVAFILGLLVSRSKSIGTSMIAHGIINSLGDLLLHFSW